jgi:cephalosporin hydroxylase
MNFESLKQNCYHRVAVGPFEGNTSVVVGSDIVLHLPVLEYYASLCETVVEFGVREGQSTVALLSGRPKKVLSFDIERSPIVTRLLHMQLPCEWGFQQLDTGSAEVADQVPECDMLFVDTLHTYDHVTKELFLHGRKAKKFLAFHDTYTCGERDLSGPNPNAKGILPAINEFMDVFPGEYETAFITNACNGLWIIKRK